MFSDRWEMTGVCRKLAVTKGLIFLPPERSSHTRLSIRLHSIRIVSIFGG